MPSIPVGDVLRMFFKGGIIGKLLGMLKGTKIQKGDFEILLENRPSISDNVPSEFTKPHKVEPPDITSSQQRGRQR
jgi:hypothetical protein